MQIFQRYEKKSGRTVEYYDFYYLFGLFRMLVVVQQMYYRYYHGQTRDRRFKEIVQMVRRAFDQVLKDRELLAEAKKAKLDVEPMSGQELEEIVNGLFKLTINTRRARSLSRSSFGSGDIALSYCP